MYKLIIGLVPVLLIIGCSSIPKGAQVVTPFDKERYLGKWYEIARKDNRFEKNLTNVTAEYSLREDGKIRVINSGYNSSKQRQSRVEGKAKFRDDERSGALKVSFFGPFYAGYNVIAIDSAYKYALVAGKNVKYLWLLSRSKTIPAEIKERYLQKAVAAGYDVADLVWVKQE